MKVGIIGGSFNPIHVAHLIIADRFVEQMELDICIFVPACQSPFKTSPSAQAEPSPEHRLEMVRRSIQLNPYFQVSDVELRRGGVSYTIDTVRSIHEQYPGAELFLLVGSDQALEFVRWKEWPEIVSRTQLCIVRRPFLLTPDQEHRISEGLTIGGKEPAWISAPLLELSSTEIRERIAHGRTTNYMMVKSVNDYIREYGLYNSHTDR